MISVLLQYWIESVSACHIQMQQEIEHCFTYKAYLRLRWLLRKFEASVKKNCYTCSIQSTVHCFPLVSSTFCKAYKSCTENTGHVLEWSTNRSNSWLLYGIERAGKPGLVPWVETGKNLWETCLENMEGGVALPISEVSSKSWPLLQRGAKNC